MLETLQQIIYFFGRGLCHQYQSRSLEAGGLYFGVCARDTGIFLGLALTVALICLFYARAPVKPSGMPRPGTVLCCVLLMLPMAIDGLSSYLGLRATTNLIRYASGYLCGSAVGVLAAPAALDFWRSRDPGRPVLAKPQSLAAVLVASYALGALFYLGYPALGIAAPLLLLAVELAVFAGINLLIIR